MFHCPSIPAPAVRLLPLVILGALSAGCVVSGAEGRYVEHEEKRFSVDGKPDVKLSTGDGSIEIRPWDRQEVLVVVEKRAFSKEAAAAMEISTRQDANHVSVEVRVRPSQALSGLFWGGFHSAKLIVSVPAASDVSATTGDGSIDLEGVGGVLSLRSGDGSIRAREASGTLAARSGDGSIRLDGIKGAVDVNTGDGSVVASGTFTAVRARSGDGSIGIHAQAGSTTEADWDLWSGDGSISVDVPENFGAEIDAHTGDGSVHLNGIELSNVSGEIGRNRVSGRLGAGGHQMRIRTGDGSISLKRVSAQ